MKQSVWSSKNPLLVAEKSYLKRTFTTGFAVTAVVKGTKDAGVLLTYRFLTSVVLISREHHQRQHCATCAPALLESCWNLGSDVWMRKVNYLVHVGKSTRTIFWVWKKFHTKIKAFAHKILISKTKRIVIRILCALST